MESENVRGLLLRSALKINSMSDAGEEKAVVIKTERKRTDHALLARLIVREGKAFKDSALAAGYSLNVARRGLKALTDDCKGFAAAMQAESEQLVREHRIHHITLPGLKPLAIQRLHDEISNPRSPNAMKAIELAGRFKETDWFVRNADVSLGVLVALGEQAPDATAEAIDAYSADETKP